MKISTCVDLLAVGGVAFVGAGLYQVRPFLVLIFAGLALLAAARVLAIRETPASVAKEEN